jgi:ADP-heptose:LPS heptosyltransferase
MTGVNMKNQEALPNRSLWRKLRGRNCLIIRTGALGDALLTLPLLRALKFSGARRVVVLGTPGSWRFLSNKVSGAFEVELWDAGDFRWAGLFSNMASLSQECLERLKPFSRAYLFQKNVTVYAPSPLVGEGWGGGGESRQC